MIDRELITRKMSLILEDVAAMTRLSRLSRAQYLEDSINEALAERYLERAIGRMIDINFHLITESGHAPPKDYHESFIRLGTLGVMTSDLAKETAMAAGLRNRIVHEYDDIDPNPHDSRALLLQSRIRCCDKPGGERARRSVLQRPVSRTPQSFAAPHARLATRLHDFATNPRESCGLS